MGSKQTRLQLDQLTDYRAFERLCNALMVKYGYTEFEPLGGTNDKGRDAVHYCAQKNEHTVFSYSVRQDWERKLFEDLEKIRRHDHPCQVVVYVTTQEISAADQDRVKARVRDTYGWRLRVCDLEWLSTLVDKHADLKRMYPEIFFLPEPGESPYVPLDLQGYVASVRERHHEWRERYTPLFADHFEFDLLVAEKRPLGTGEPLPVTRLPQEAPLTVLLGESGAGKTTTLWKLALDCALGWEEGHRPPVPILVPLRNWAPGTPVEDLAVQAFAPVQGHPAAVRGLLARGEALVLLDGLNELPADPRVRADAGRDLRTFLDRYPGARHVVTCRTSDYDEALLDNGRGALPRTYEAQRLTATQVGDYVGRSLPPERAAEFNHQLRLHDERAWEDTSSILHLAQIPFHLRLMIKQFEVTGALPAGTAPLVQGLVRRMGAPKAGCRAPGVDAYRKERILATLAGAGLRDGATMSLAVPVARGTVEEVVRTLRGEGVIAGEVTADGVWSDLLSENYLNYERHRTGAVTTRRWDTVEWLHQLFQDYFLALYLTAVLLQGDQPSRQLVRRWLWNAPRTFQQACLMALELLTLPRKRLVFDEFRWVPGPLAENLLGQLPQREIETMLLDGVRACLAQEACSAQALEDAALYHYTGGLPGLFVEAFRSVPLPHKQAIAATNCAYAIKFQTRPGAQRAQQNAEAWIGHQDELVRFYAAKTLWAKDRGLAARALETLAQRGTGRARTLAAELIAAWQPE
ncbi:NACHT domain-containing protein [Deinococcus aestuarii]|uniref:NACHT domain-containing protein n=1 Tax=Deinococcus aestuarii TaxID=2774531 RepID=UPI001C0DF280|nr:NACHT domain-containing protein [Deinococcus aestuarii]